jgi:hypothetical protein
MNQISSPLRFSLFQIKKEICNKKNEIFLFEIETFLIVSNEACIKRFLNAPTRHFCCFLPSKICTYFFYSSRSHCGCVCWSTRRVFFTAVQIAYCDDACRQSRRNKKEKNLIFFQQCHQIKVEKRKETNSFIQVLIILVVRLWIAALRDRLDSGRQTHQIPFGMHFFILPFWIACHF